jgi:hypothetical protein
VRVGGGGRAPEIPQSKCYEGIMNGDILLKLASIGGTVARNLAAGEGAGATLLPPTPHPLPTLSRLYRHYQPTHTGTRPPVLQRVEASPADLKVTDAKTMCQTFKAAFGQHD